MVVFHCTSWSCKKTPASMWRLGEKAQPNSISLQRRENANIEGLIPSYGSWIHFFEKKQTNFAVFFFLFLFFWIFFMSPIQHSGWRKFLFQKMQISYINTSSILYSGRYMVEMRNWNMHITRSPALVRHAPVTETCTATSSTRPLARALNTPLNWAGTF